MFLKAQRRNTPVRNFYRVATCPKDCRVSQALTPAYGAEAAREKFFTHAGETFPGVATRFDVVNGGVYFGGTYVGPA